MEETEAVTETLQIGKGKPGPGRPKGLANKLTVEVKQMVLEALEGAGGVSYLISKADTHPAAFLALVGKVIPLQVTGKLEHEHSGSLSAETSGFLAEVRAIASRPSGETPLSH